MSENNEMKVGESVVLSVGGTSVTVERRSKDYKAYITGESGKWDHHWDMDGAVQELKKTYPQEF